MPAAVAAGNYTLAVPTAPIVRDTTDPARNAWLASNAVASVSASLAPISHDARRIDTLPKVEMRLVKKDNPTSSSHWWDTVVSKPVTNSVAVTNFVAVGTRYSSAANTPGLQRFTLEESVAGFSVERIQPQLWLGDALPTPEGVDWNATWEEYASNATERTEFIFDNKGMAVYVQTGGNLTFRWIMSGGATNDMTYVVSGNVKGRPYRMFWTESPWNAPVISLSGRFVKLYGPGSLVVPEYGERTRDVGGQRVTETNVVVKGVYYDPEAETLSALGQLSGQFILAYYDSGSYTTLKHLQVVEVGEPSVETVNAVIGEPIEPYITGYNPDGLVPAPIDNATAADDEFGDYYYQHRGIHSYSPKNGMVFPLRDTKDSPWRIDVYWMESDPYGVQWPFERCQYSADWSPHPALLIAGDHVKIPSDYQAELCKFQVPNGHALAPDNNLFTTKTNGISLLKLSLTDDVFFQTVRTVNRTDSDCFTLEEEEWFVGTEITPRGGAVDGTTESYNPVIDASVPGYLDLAHSGDNYNPNLYYDWTTASNGFQSVVYGVNASSTNEALEMHWYMSVRKEGMPSAVYFPCLAQRYRIVWPQADQVPQIVLASARGGAAESVYESGHSLYIAATNSFMLMPDARCFNRHGGTVAFWAKAEACATNTTGRVLTLGAYGAYESGEGGSPPFSLFVDASVAADGTVGYTLTGGAGDTTATIAATLPPSSPASPAEGWHRIVFAMDGTNWTAYVDGRSVAAAVAPQMDYSGYIEYNVVGSPGEDLPAPVGLALDGLAVAAAVPSAEAVSNGLYSVEGFSDLALSMYFDFPDGDLEPVSGTSLRFATEAVSGDGTFAYMVLRESPGAPVKGTGLFESDTKPVVYRQAVRGAVGYNPNEEHAFIGGDSIQGYYPWALRTDLNTADSSEPFVLVECEKDGRKAMRAFSVLVTNDTYTALAGVATAGTILPGPHPLDLFANPWLTNDWWEVKAGEPAIAWPDRKNQIWSRASGTLDIHMFYPNQDGFDFPSLAANPAPGTPIPWLASLDGDDPLAGDPAAWRWTVEWPRNVETMRIGETLAKAANGLPEVWNSKSVAVVWPEDSGSTVLLWDPTVVRTTGDSSYATPADLVAAFGFDVADGSVKLRAGKYTFPDLPPSVSDRFYVNANLAPANCVSFQGVMESNAGGDILWPNALNSSELEAIKALVRVDHPKKAEWDRLISTLPTTPVEPSVLNAGSGSGRDAVKPSVSYTPRDHYALTAMGATNYVTIIENDAPVDGPNGVKDGDAVSMHVFAVTNRYYAGRVVTREDPLNLLSQQLGIVYTESLAGKADDFVFEWKKATPEDDGRMPTDYANDYESVGEPTAGLTRFTIGQQGDTLANLVNTYYVMRYRAKEGTDAYAVMGDEWSAWCGPALAEGWIQRCVNNVTPFTQRMTDLYENAAELRATMLEAAGRPWTGDVALNQDNLNEVGLVELYQTLLNKAESMSLTLGLNDTDANKQLLLAAERLADLYMVLGNEAYADALNPTVGFGATFGESSARGDQIDYGAEHTGLFCFDNQVPSLLDEELALLRGRTGANNPSVTVAPFYNRLVWNYTRGITAGEVAYAMNYNIFSSNNDAIIDENDAALHYPQGHGDAYGHYLSALGVWYRLLRNPNFSWSVSQMQMNVADNVVDVDYFDEERFAEIAAKVAETSALVVDRTVMKSWKENGGASGAGYLDGDEERAFGYGEWATRGGVGAVMNWMVANSMLPAAEKAGDFYRLRFDGETYIEMDEAPLDGDWTLEFQLSPTEMFANRSLLEIWGGQSEVLPHPLADSGEVYATEPTLLLDVDGEGGLAATLALNRLYLASSTTTNEHVVVETNELDVATVTTNMAESVEYYLVYGQADRASAASVPGAAGTLFALHSDENGLLTLRAFASDGTKIAEQTLGTQTFDDAAIMMGRGLAGYISEIRLWRGSRTDAELVAGRNYVNPRHEDLLAYTRCVADSSGGETLADETPGGDCIWSIYGGEWVGVPESGIGIDFDDDGLLRINRSTASSLGEIASAASAIQKSLDKADAGMNPLGLSESAVPFDLAPGDGEGDNDDAGSHFEQIAARAETALANAAKVLDRAQEAATHLRQVTNTQLNEEEQAAASEADFQNQLIEIYGTPYADDIGPAGTYPQGYTGPDLYHYMYMDLAAFGLSGADIKPVAVVTYDKSTDKWKYESMKSFAESTAVNSSTNVLTYQMSANGLVNKPASFTGKRQSAGRIQDAYTDYILAYVACRNALENYNGKIDRLSTEIDWIDSLYAKKSSSHDAELAKIRGKYATDTILMALKNSSIAMDTIKEAAEGLDNYAGRAGSMSLVGVGMTAVLIPGLAAYIASGTASLGAKEQAIVLKGVFDGLIEETQYVQNMIETAAEEAAEGASWTDAQESAYASARDLVCGVGEAARELRAAWAAMVAAAENFDTVAAEGDRVQASRKGARAQRENRIIKLRYNDMVFRNVQDSALTRYKAAFDLAQKYVYMAAQAYDYETGMLSADKASGDAFKGEIVGARAIGKLDADGKPVLGGGLGDAGLADILARMKSNYLVLKPRLGINNPDRNATWFSLRRELFRISSGTNGNYAWRKELSKYVVPDLRSVPEYQRFCQPAASSGQTGALTASKEPALVIPFSSTIDFAKNFFGRELAAGDHALDSSYYATKIASAGVKFEGYPAAALSATPVVYLVPAGADSMRVPGGGANGRVLTFNVLDQVIPAPYEIGSTELDDEDWTPTYTGYTAGGDVAAKIRRIPSFRAMTGDDDDADRANKRLYGRSAWNTRWLMIIPAGQLLGGSAESREAALDTFINGADTDHDGSVDEPGVTDIKLGLKTYSHSGN